MRFAICVVLLLVRWSASQAYAQVQAAVVAPGPAIPTFAVASIRPNPNPTNLRLQFTVDGFVGEGVTLHLLIQMAYGIFEYDPVVGEPAWADRDCFDVSAKIDDSFSSGFAGLSMDQRRQMLQVLLADRFGLKIHRKTVQRPVYELVIAPGGPKLTAAGPDDLHPTQIEGTGGKVISRGIDHIQVEGWPIDALASYLSSDQIVDRPIVNRTGLTGFYNFSLHWVPEDHSGSPQGDVQTGPSAAAPARSSTIFTEIQKQLGLKLQQSKGPVETIVVDHAARPTPN